MMEESLKSSKGGSFERSVSKSISLWVSEGEDDSWIWRTSQSGGRATQRAKSGKNTSGAYGDLTFTDGRASWLFDIFSMELKCGYKMAEISSLIDSTQAEPLILKFWRQCERDRELSGSKFSLVILKRDRKSPLVIVGNDLFSKLVLNFSKPECGTISFSGKIENLVFIPFDEFFNWIDPVLLKSIKW
jgi:hypothetical protein